MSQILNIKSESIFSLGVVAFVLALILISMDLRFNEKQVVVETINLSPPPPTKKIVKKMNETKCLASVIYHEARGEPIQGQIAVGQVVLNRVKSKHYPNNICKVVFQPYQFTDHTKIKYSEKTMELAIDILRNSKKMITAATHFHTYDVEPKWALDERMIPVGQIGRHLFYKMS